MNRAQFFAATTAGLALGMQPLFAAPIPAFVRSERIRVGATLSLAEMLAQYPAAVSGDLVQYELGFGAAYDKQIGFGQEIDGDDRL